MKRTIALLPGDGIGPEICAQAVRVLQVIEKKFGHEFNLREALVGGAAFEKFQNHCPDETLTLCKNADAILFGAVGGPISESHLPKWNKCETNSILALRKYFQFRANLRPVTVYPELASASPLRAEIVEKGLDLLFVRELLGDIYFGEHKTTGNPGNRAAFDGCEYTEEQISKIALVAFRSAEIRRRKLTSVDKANVLDTSKLWRTVVSEISPQFSGVELSHMLVDNCAMQIVINPGQFDVILTGNMFGDILSDAAAVLPGSLGLLASASLNDEGFGLFEPPSGSAPELAGRNIANPIGQILSLALLLRYSFQLEEEASAIELAVKSAVQRGARTADISSETKSISTAEMGDAIIESFSL